jgi:type IV pilus assembly protein PilY1
MKRLIILITLFLIAIPTLIYTQTMSEYCSVPPYVTRTIKPNVMVMMDNSQVMNNEAYGDAKATFDPVLDSYYYVEKIGDGIGDDDGICENDETCEPVQFPSGGPGIFGGYFDRSLKYSYSGNRFEPDNGTTADPNDDGQPGIFSGNLLNWATMSRYDLLEKILLGGKSVSRVANPHTLVSVGVDWSKTLKYTVGAKTYTCIFNVSGGNLRITEPSPCECGLLDPTLACPDPIVPPLAFNEQSNSPTAFASLMKGVKYLAQKIKDFGDALFSSQANAAACLLRIIPAKGTAIELPNGNVGDPYSYTINAEKGTTPFTWSISLGSLPLGLSLTKGVDVPPADGNAIISGTPNPGTEGTYNFTVLVTDSAGCSDTQKYSLTIGAGGGRTSQNYNVRVAIGDYTCDISNGDTCCDTYIPSSTANYKCKNTDSDSSNGLEFTKWGIVYEFWDDARFGLQDFSQQGNTISTKIEKCINPDPTKPVAGEMPDSDFLTAIENATAVGDASLLTQLGNGEYTAVNYFMGKENPGCGDKDPLSAQDTARECRKNFILIITAGEGADLGTNVHDSGCSTSPYSLVDNACYGYNRDIRPIDIDGMQRVYTYIANTMGINGTILGAAANAGGGKYYEIADPTKLEEELVRAFQDILGRAASGTAVSVLTTSARGSGSIIQAYFLPVRKEGIKDIYWTGYAHNIWIDPQDNLREDTTHDYQLRLDQDDLIKLYFNNSTNETEAAIFETDVNGKVITSCSSPTIKRFSDITSLWEAGKKLALINATDNGTERNIFTAIPGGDGMGTAFGTPFTVTNVTGNATLSSALNPDATYTAEKIVRYIRGVDLESTDTNFRDRRITVDSALHVWKLGDIISSTPKVLANTPLNTYHIDYNDRTYYDYLASSSYKQRSSVAFVGANDGMLHAFRVGYLKDKSDSYGTLGAYVKALFKNFFGSGDAANDELGKEIWAYIPYNAFPYLKYLANPAYCHIYYADLSVRLIDASTKRNSPASQRIDKDDWQTILIGGMRFGGACSGIDASPTGPPIGGVGYSSYFAIDITDPENPVPLWEFTDADLGYTTTYPSIIRTGDRNNNGYWYVAFGSGSKVLPKGGVDIGKSTTGYIYILDLKTGTLVKKIQLDHYAIVGDILAIDANKDYWAEKIYFGTAYKPWAVWQGKLMSIGIPNEQLSAGSSTPITTLFTGNYPFTASPDAAKDKSGKVWVYAGSGKYYSDVDESDASTQIFFGLKDENATVLEDNLYNATYDETTGTVTGTTTVCMYDPDAGTWGEKTVVTSITPTAYTTSITEPGWKVYLSCTNSAGNPCTADDIAAGDCKCERIISRPLAVGGLVDFLTYKPSSDMCSYGGDSYIYSLSYTTGVAPYNVSILSPKITSGTTGTVTVRKGVLLGPGAPPTGEAIIIAPPKEGEEELKKKIQIATGVVVEAENEPVFSVISKIVHWLKK